MKAVTHLALMVMLICLLNQLVIANDVDNFYNNLIGFVPDHVEISGFIVADYLKDNPKVLKIEATGDVVAIRYFASLVAASDRIEVDAKMLNGAASGPGLALKFSKGKQSADIMLSGISCFVIENSDHPRAFNLQPDQYGHTFVTKLTDSLTIHLRGRRQKIWSRVVAKAPK